MDRKLAAGRIQGARSSDLVESTTNLFSAGFGWIVIGLLVSVFLVWALLLGNQLGARD